jgi:hypothetical protein
MLATCSISPPEGWGSQKPPAGVSIDRGHPLSRGLNSFFAFNEVAGSRVIDPASGFFGSIQNANLSAARCASAIGPVVTLDGVDDRILLNGPAVSATSPFSVCMLVYLNSFNGGFPTGGFPCCARIATKDSSLAWWIAFGDASLGSAFQGLTFGSSSVWACRKTDTPYATLLNVWKHVAVVYNGMGAGTAGNFRGFLDGKELATTNAGGYGAAPANVTELSGSESYAHWNGKIAYFGLWNRALTAQEVLEQYTRPYCMFEAGIPLAADSLGRPLIDGSLASDTPLLGALT